MASRYFQRISVFLVCLSLGGRVAHAGTSASCPSETYYKDDTDEAKCAKAASYDDCVQERNACLSANTKKSVCIVPAKACAAKVYALKKEAAQCVWRSRMDKIFKRNESSDAIKSPCKKKVIAEREIALAGAKKDYTEFNAKTKMDASAKESSK